MQHAVSVLPRLHRKSILASSLGNSSQSRCDFPIKVILYPTCISSTLWKFNISHRLHAIHSTVHPSHSSFFPIFLGKQLFTKTAASDIHRGWEAIKNSSQCCILVNPFLSRHIIPSLMLFSFFWAHIHSHKHQFMGSHTECDGGTVWRFTFFPIHKSPNSQWHGTVGFMALLRSELRGAM